VCSDHRAGTLVLVVGPSGAGKDTLLRLAAQELSGEPWVVFARRCVTRPPNLHEDHESLDLVHFARLARDGAFLLTWAAHGLAYGIPASYRRDLDAGRIVVANASRGVVAEAQRRCPCRVVFVTAPADVLAARIAARRREQAEGSRLEARGQPGDIGHDLLIENIGQPAESAAKLVSFLKALRGLPATIVA
jgi:ribose 1,5-bisphosphokinase